MMKRTRMNETAEALRGVFLLAALACGALLLAAAAVALLPVVVVGAVLLALYGLAWSAWREIVPVGREAKNWKALCDLVVPAGEALVEFDRRSRRDFNDLVHTGDWAEFLGETPRPAFAAVGFGPVAVEDLAAETVVAAAAQPGQPAEDNRPTTVRDLLEQLAEGWTVTEATVRTDAAGNVHVSDAKVTENVRLAGDDPSENGADDPSDADGSREDRSGAGNGDTAATQSLDALPRAHADEDLDGPAWTLLPDDAPDPSDSDGVADRIHLDAPVPFLPIDSPILHTLPAADLAPAESTMTPQTPEAPQLAVGPATVEPAPDASLAKPRGSRRKPAPKAVPMPTAARATAPAGTGDEVLDRALELLEEGKSQREAARQLGVSESTLRGKLNRHKKARQADAA